MQSALDRENLRDSVKRGSSLLICRGGPRAGRRTPSECYIRKKGVYWVQLNGGPAALGPDSLEKNSSLLEFQLEKCALHREKAKKE